MKFIYDSISVVEEQLSLIVISNLDVVTVLDTACSCYQITHQHLQKSSLTYTVGTDDAYPLASLDVKIYVFEKLFCPRSVSESLAQVFSIYDILTALEVFFEASTLFLKYFKYSLKSALKLSSCQSRRV